MRAGIVSCLIIVTLVLVTSATAVAVSTVTETKPESAGQQTDKGTEKGDAGLQILPKPEERMAPIETDTIDEASRHITTKLEEIAVRLSRIAGNWVYSDAVLGIPWIKLVFSLVVLGVVLLFERILYSIIRKRLDRITEENRPPTWPEVLLGAVYKPLALFIWIYGAYTALSPIFLHLDMPWETNVLKDTAKQIADTGGLLALIWFVVRVFRLVDLELERRAQSPESRIDDLEASLIGKTLRWIVILFGALVVFQYVTGIAAGPLIASLGIGGLAIALAAKESISNMFGTVTIVFDKPFKVGDRIKLDDFDGFVEAVGYRSTRLRLWNGNLLTVPNQRVISSTVENFARRRHIWWRTDITITYDTPPDKVDKAVQRIKEILAEDEETSRDSPCWVFFDAFNEWSLNIRVLAYFKPFGKEPVQPDYLAWRERLCRKILRAFEEEGISFAFPTRTTHLANDDKRQLKLQMLMGDSGSMQ